MNYFLLNVLPQIATILIALMYVPQIVITHKTKNVEGIAVSFWILLVAALSVNTTNALIIYTTSGVYGTLITQSVNLTLAITVLAQVAYYKLNAKNKGE